MTSGRLLIIAVSLLLPQAGHSEEPVSIAFGVSSLGGNIEAAYRVNERFALRGIVSGGLSGSDTETLDGTSYEVSGELGGFSLLGDYYPRGGGFHVSGGLHFSNTDFSGSAVASASNPIQIGGTTLSSGELVQVTGGFARETAPMLSIGYDQPIGRRAFISAELGAIFANGADIGVSAPGVSQADIDREIESIEDDAGDFNAYPYIGLTFGFRF